MRWWSLVLLLMLLPACGREEAPTTPGSGPGSTSAPSAPLDSPKDPPQPAGQATEPPPPHDHPLGQYWHDVPAPTLQPWEPPEVAGTSCPDGFIHHPGATDLTFGEADDEAVRACSCVPFVLRPASFDVAPFCMDAHPFPGDGHPWPSDAQFGSTRFSLIEDLRHLLPRWGRRLCTYGENLYAAAGPGNQRHVGSDAFVPGRCEEDHENPDSPIGSHPKCRSDRGVVDLNVRSEWVLVDPWSAAAMKPLGFREVEAGMLALSTANTDEGGNSAASSNFGFHFHVVPWGFFDPGDPPGDGYIDDGVRFCATPGMEVPPDREAEYQRLTQRFVDTGDWSALWAAPVESGTSRLTGWTTVDAGRNHSCGLQGSGRPVCWGSDHWGESAAPSTEVFTSISVGWRHSCGLRPDGTIACWGDDAMGQASPPEGTYTAVGAGDFFTCGLTTAGEARCWGKIQRDSWAKPPAGVTFQHLAVGDRNACGISGGAVLCWGETRWPQGQAPAEYTFDHLEMGYEETCGLANDGGVVSCWGNLDRIKRSIPERTGQRGVATGGRLRCTLDAQGRMDCVDELARPELVGPPSGPAATDAAQFTQLSIGYAHACGIRSGGALECWGGDSFGQASPP